MGLSLFKGTQKIDDFEYKEEEVKVLRSEIIKIEDKKSYKLPTKNYHFHILTSTKIHSMNKVSIINFNLHKKYLLEDHKEPQPQASFKQTSKRRNKSPQDTLRRLVRKGLVNYISPFSRSKSGFKLDSDKENTNMRHSQGSCIGNETGFMNKYQSSSSMFMCSRGHGTSLNSKYRVHTEEKENLNGNTRYMINKTMKSGDLDEVLPTGSHMFRDFRNITEQSLGRLHVENERRNFKLELVHKVKYDSTWKKYPVPSKSKEKMTSQHNQGIRKGILR